MTIEEIIQQHDEIVKELNKYFTIIYKEIFDGYVDNVMHYRIKELPDWLFAVWPMEQLGKKGFWSFCEHNNLLNKFKRGRCYNDKAFIFMDDYIKDIKDIVADEEKHYYISSGEMEEYLYINKGEHDPSINVEWDEETMRGKAERLFRMYKTKIKRQGVLKRKKHEVLVTSLEPVLESIPNLRRHNLKFVCNSTYSNFGVLNIKLIFDKGFACTDEMLSKYFKEIYTENHYKHSSIEWRTNIWITDSACSDAEYEKDLQELDE